jgi:hypothetical protein
MGLIAAASQSHACMHACNAVLCCCCCVAGWLGLMRVRPYRKVEKNESNPETPAAFAAAPVERECL